MSAAFLGYLLALAAGTNMLVVYPSILPEQLLSSVQSME
jgi:hypothetical protein